MELTGWVRRAAEIVVVIAAGAAVFVAWLKVWVQHQAYLPIVVAVPMVALAVWIFLGRFGIVRLPKFFWGYPRDPEDWR